MDYKKQIEEILSKNNWEIIYIDANIFWWDFEHWQIRNTKSQNELFVCFIANPENEKLTTEVRLTTNFDEHQNCITTLDMRKGLFDQKLKQFENALNSIENF